MIEEQTRPKRLGLGGQRGLLTLLLTGALALALAAPAAAIDFSVDGDGEVKVATDTACPTLTSPPEPFEAWLNTDDFEKRGYLDPKNQTPWSFASRMAQVICGTADNATIKIGFFFIRALGTMTEAGLGSRPESDPEVIWDALQYVHDKRGVTVQVVIDKGSTTGSALDKVKQRLVDTGIVDSIYLCYNGCFNTNSKSVFPYALNHEKFITISDTNYPGETSGVHPVVMQSSGNIARSQIRTYLQEATVFYDDYSMWDLLQARADGMVYCATSNTRCKSSSGVPSGHGLTLRKSRGIWVDTAIRHYTDPDRGTAIAFSPQPTSTADYYISQFDGVDCAVDTRIRIAMFKMTDEKSATMVKSLASLQKRGCDVKILMSRSYGSTVFSSKVLKTLKSAKIPFKCAAFPMHTKLILIGPKYSNSGRILTGTANMSVAGLRYSEEHVITIDTRRAVGEYQESAQRLFGEYMTQWYELSQGGRTCK